MNALLFADIAFDSDEAWENFQLLHGLSHQTVYEQISQTDTMGNVPTYFPLFTFPREDNTDYLLDHWRVHQSNAALLGLTDLPDLSSVDLSDEGQFRDWNALHAQVHLNENVALGLL